MSLKDAIRTAAQEQKRQSSQGKSDHNTGMPANQDAVVPASDSRRPDYTNLTIRVTKQQRLHWLIEAKKQGTSLTAAIVDALNARFGEPADG